MPVGRVRSFRIFALIRLALAGDARATYTLWSNCHWQLLDFDSLRGAPPQGKAGVRIATSAAGLLAMTYVFDSVLKYRGIATPVMRCIKV